MEWSRLFRTRNILAALVCALFLSACGGGSIGIGIDTTGGGEPELPADEPNTPAETTLSLTGTIEDPMTVFTPAISDITFDPATIAVRVTLEGESIGDCSVDTSALTYRCELTTEPTEGAILLIAAGPLASSCTVALENDAIDCGETSLATTLALLALDSGAAASEASPLSSAAPAVAPAPEQLEEYALLATALDIRYLESDREIDNTSVMQELAAVVRSVLEGAPETNDAFTAIVGSITSYGNLLGELDDAILQNTVSAMTFLWTEIAVPQYYEQLFRYVELVEEEIELPNIPQMLVSFGTYFDVLNALLDPVTFEAVVATVMDPTPPDANDLTVFQNQFNAFQAFSPDWSTITDIATWRRIRGEAMAYSTILIDGDLGMPSLFFEELDAVIACIAVAEVTLSIDGAFFTVLLSADPATLADFLAVPAVDACLAQIDPGLDADEIERLQMISGIAAALIGSTTGIAPAEATIVITTP